jgi:site-specific DNA recombinase
MREKVMRGELVGAAPLGYKNVRDYRGAHIKVDEENASKVRAIFELAAKKDHSIRELQKLAEVEGLRSRNGKSLGVSALWYILTNPFYVGFVKCGDEMICGRHQAIVDEVTFNKVQEGLFKRKKLLEK